MVYGTLNAVGVEFGATFFKTPSLMFGTYVTVLHSGFLLHAANTSATVPFMRDNSDPW
jgi:hypothetical protein